MSPSPSPVAHEGADCTPGKSSLHLGKAFRETRAKEKPWIIRNMVRNGGRARRPKLCFRMDDASDLTVHVRSIQRKSRQLDGQPDQEFLKSVTQKAVHMAEVSLASEEAVKKFMHICRSSLNRLVGNCITNNV